MNFVKSIKLQNYGIISSLLITFGFTVIVIAEETVIQEEEISYEKCLVVIDVSESKLSISPKVTQVSDQVRMAEFGLSDGLLTITCDGKKGTVTVATKLN